MRVCTIDIGTNSVRSLVGDVEKSAKVKVVQRESHITRLGEGLSCSGFLCQAAIERTARAVEGIADRAKRLGAERFKVVATSAARKARNSDDLKERIKKLASLGLEIISGIGEARYVCEGAMSSLELKGKNALVADIGGGSTELIFVGLDEKPVLSSVGEGAVYITEKFIRHDPPLDTELSLAFEHARVALGKAVAELPQGAEELIGLGGTVTTIPPIIMGMETYDPSRVHNYVVAARQVESLLRRLRSMQLTERKGVVGLEPGREDIIIGGLIIVKALLTAAGFRTLRVSDEGILLGLALSIRPEAG